jgi:peroxiredoxin
MAAAQAARSYRPDPSTPTPTGYRALTPEEIKNAPYSGEFKNTLYDWQGMPHQMDTADEMTNPADQYNPEAYNKYLEDMMAGGGAGAGNQDAEWARKFRESMAAGGGEPTAPTIEGPNTYNRNIPGWSGANTDTLGLGRPTSQGGGGTDWSGGTQPTSPTLGGAQTYESKLPGYQAPNVASAGRPTAFDPSKVAGPQLPTVGGAGGDYTGPGSGAPTFADTMSLARTLGAAPGAMPREATLGGTAPTGSGFETSQMFTDPTSLGYKAYQEALKGSTSLAGAEGGIDTTALGASLDANAKRQMELAAQAGRNAAGARGFTAAEGTIAQGEMGSRLSDAMLEAEARKRESLMGAETTNAELRAQQRIAGSGQLASLGSSAASSGAQAAQLYQSEAERKGSEALTARGQNVDMRGQDVTQRAQDIGREQSLASTGAQNVSAMADLVRAYNEGDIGRYAEGTSRGKAQGDLNMQEQTLRQSGVLSGYENQSQRMEVLANAASQGNTDAKALYDSETQRMNVQGTLENSARELAASNGLAYDTLDAQQKQDYNKQAIDKYKAETGQYEAETGRKTAETTAGQQQYANESDQYANETARLLGMTNAQQAGEQFASTMGLKYDELSSTDKQAYNQLGVDLYKAQSGQYANVTEREKAMLDNAAQMYQTGTQGQVDTARIAADLLNDSTDAMAAYQKMMMDAAAGDQNAMVALTTLYRNGEITKYLARKQQTGEIIGGALSAAGSVAGAIIGKPPSDVNLKENIVLVNTDEVLAKVEALPVFRWNYKAGSGENHRVSHIGPMAQDFHAVFGLNDDDKHLDLIDSNGVLLAAVKELARRVKELEAR